MEGTQLYRAEGRECEGRNGRGPKKSGGPGSQVGPQGECRLLPCSSLSSSTPLGQLLAGGPALSLGRAQGCGVVQVQKTHLTTALRDPSMSWVGASSLKFPFRVVCLPLGGRR